MQLDALRPTQNGETVSLTAGKSSNHASVWQTPALTAVLHLTSPSNQCLVLWGVVGFASPRLETSEEYSAEQPDAREIACGDALALRPATWMCHPAVSNDHNTAVSVAIFGGPNARL
jgi:hypothetical protein